MNNVLIKSEKYNGKYVAIKSFTDYTVIGEGKEPKEAIEEANKKGYTNPVVIFVPHEDMVQIY